MNNLRKVYTKYPQEVKCVKCGKELEGHAMWQECLMYYCTNKDCDRLRLYVSLTDEELKEIYG